MRIDLSTIPQQYRDRAMQIGDVYPAKGGRGGTKFFLIVGITNGSMAHCLGLDAEGQIVSTASYYLTSLEGRARAGYVEGLEDLQLPIHWEQ